MQERDVTPWHGCSSEAIVKKLAEYDAAGLVDTKVEQRGRWGSKLLEIWDKGPKYIGVVDQGMTLGLSLIHI